MQQVFLLILDKREVDSANLCNVIQGCSWPSCSNSIHFVWLPWSLDKMAAFLFHWPLGNLNEILDM